MRPGILAILWSDALGSVLGLGLVLLFVFSVAMVIVALHSFTPVVRAYVRGGRTEAQRERFNEAKRAREMALAAIIVGPLLSVFLLGIVGLIAVFVAPTLPGLMEAAGFFILMILLGALAGLIAAGAFLTASSVLGRVRKTIKKWKGGGVWDPDLDVLA